MERVSVMASLRDGKDGALPLDLRTLGAWMRQLVFRMVAWDADARRAILALSSRGNVLRLCK